MFCDNCGKSVADEAKFCRHCGYTLVLANSQFERQASAVYDHKDVASIVPNAPSIAAIETINFESTKHSSQINELEIAPKLEKNKTSTGFGCLSFIIVIIAGVIGKVIAKSLIRDPGASLYISHLGGGLLIGAMCGLIPLYFSKKCAKSFDRPLLISWGSVLLCVIAGFIGGVPFALPTGLIISSCIWYVSWSKNR